MTFELPRPRTGMIKKACSYKSATRWKALENQMRSICDSDAFKKSLSVLLSHIYCKYDEFLYWFYCYLLGGFILFIVHDRFSFAEPFLIVIK